MPTAAVRTSKFCIGVVKLTCFWWFTLQPTSYDEPVPAPQGDDQPRIDDIRVEYHPKSGRGTKIYHFEDFERERPKWAAFGKDSHKPYAPFNSLEDFKFAEVALQGGLSREQVEVLLGIIEGARGSESAFTLRSWDDLQLAWEKASVHYPPVRRLRSRCVLLCQL